MGEKSSDELIYQSLENEFGKKHRKKNFWTKWEQAETAQQTAANIPPMRRFTITLQAETRAILALG